MGTASIDLRKAYTSRQYGDILAVLSWLNDTRALFLIPAMRRRAPWFVVLEPAAHEWDDHSSTNVRLLAQRAMKACEVLGLEQHPRTAHRIVRIVNDALPDLVRMPSRQPNDFRPASYGQLTMRADGVPIAAEEIRFEDAGATYG